VIPDQVEGFGGAVGAGGFAEALGHAFQQAQGVGVLIYQQQRFGLRRSLFEGFAQGFDGEGLAQEKGDAQAVGDICSAGQWAADDRHGKIEQAGGERPAGDDSPGVGFLDQFAGDQI